MSRFLRWLFRIEAYDPSSDVLLHHASALTLWLRERRVGNPIDEDRFPE